MTQRKVDRADVPWGQILIGLQASPLERRALDELAVTRLFSLLAILGWRVARASFGVTALLSPAHPQHKAHRTLLAAEDYDFVADGLAYLLIGHFRRWVHLYDQQRVIRDYDLGVTIGGHELYQMKEQR